MNKESQPVFKSGFVAIIGRPNSGKSTLLNALVGSKVSIVSAIPQTTRHQIRGILNLPSAQIVFVDTPGIHSFKDNLAGQLNSVAKGSLEGCDLIIYVVDIARHPGSEEGLIMDALLRQCDIPTETGKPAKILMLFNKTDIGREELAGDYLKIWQEKVKAKGLAEDPVAAYLPVSALTKQNLDKLLELITENLPENPAFYEKDTVTDFPIKFRIADMVREKLFNCLQEELPHSIAVEVSEIKEEEKITRISVTIYVERESQKKIVVGQGGKVLKEVGTASRKDIEEVLKKKVFLELWVEVKPDWQSSSRILKDLGYIE
jgi:GTP-binding protein Era